MGKRSVGREVHVWAHLKRFLGNQELRLAFARLNSHTDSNAGPVNSDSILLCFFIAGTSMQCDH